jgi:hypothetical protein
MTLILSGTDGLSDIDGTAATPAIRGTDANTGIFFGTDTVGIATGGTAAITIGTNQNTVFNSTGAITLSSGTTAERPGSPTVGMIRYNTTLSVYEAYTTIGWQTITTIPYNIEYLVVAGGAGASASSSGGAAGGGAGGFRTATDFSATAGATYTVTVGAGGAAPSPTSGSAVSGNDGSNSVFSTITSTGGGGGGAGGTNVAGRTGGSGGGGGYATGAGGAGNTPSTSPSQGNNGGAGYWRGWWRRWRWWRCKCCWW